MKNYMEPKMDIEVIETDIITWSLPPLDSGDDGVLG